MRRRRTIAAAIAAAMWMLGSASVASTPTDTAMDRLGPVPASAGALGMAVRGDRLFVLVPSGLLAFDVSTADAPVLLGRLDLAGRRIDQVLQASPRGDIVLVRVFGFTSGDNRGLLVIGAKNPAAMRVLAAEASWQESAHCVADCTWVLGGEGGVLDLRAPASPRVVGLAGTSTSWVRRAYGRDVAVNAVREVRPGVATTAPVKGVYDDQTLPIHTLDVRVPARPRVMLTANSPHDRLSFPDVVWPAGGRSRFQLAQSVFNGEDLFCTSAAPLLVYDTRVASGRRIRLHSSRRPRTGAYADGAPPVTTRLSCGGGRLAEHPAHGATGGLVASAQLEHGVRVLRLSAAGVLSDAGWSVTPGVGAYHVVWASSRPTERVLYALGDGGVDVLRFTGNV